MTTNHPVRRLLARVCSTDTMARIVDPTLADMRVEGASWRAWLALTRALALHAVMSMPGAAARVWRDDGHAIPRAASFTIRAALLTALPMMLPPMQAFSGRLGTRVASAPSIEALAVSVLLLLPQALALTLGPSLLWALPVALRDRRPTRRLARRVVGLALIGTLATAGVMLWAVPRANQAFRVVTSGNVHLERGPNETGLAALRERIDALRAIPGALPAARRLEFQFHVRLVLIAAPVPFALLALACIGTPFGRRRPWLTSLAGLALYLGVILPFLWVGQTITANSPLPPSFWAWLPMATILLAAAAVSRLAPRPAAPACA
jgi:hypothetical protein